jgi:hypothetical protein
MLMTLMAAFLGLYVLNLGGDLSGGHHGIAWAQGVRLFAEPFILLAAGLTLREPRRTLNAAVVALIATGVAEALYGIAQQYLGQWRLVDLGYSFNAQVRMIGNHLRSFGTFDHPFAYAAFLFLALAAALFWMRPGPIKAICISLMSIGLFVAYVRSAIVISIALLAMWLLSIRRVSLGFVLLGISLAVAIVFLLSSAGANETRSVRAGPSTYLTLNGRTTVWATVFSKPSRIPFGLGVGKVGTAANRATSGAITDPNKPRNTTIAVDSGYFATVADVGVVGLIVLFAILTRLAVLGTAATRRSGRIGWLVLGWLAVLGLDATARESFTGFPTAFLGLLLVGVALAAADGQGQWPKRRSNRLSRLPHAATVFRDLR